MSLPNMCSSLWLYSHNLSFSLDRVLLAGLWTVYMLEAWNVDHSDHQYQSQQLRRKQHEMAHYKLLYY